MVGPDFGLRLLRELVRAEGIGNICISPVSIALALAAALDGATGATRRAMAEALGGELGADELLDAAAALPDLLRGDDQGVELAVANSLWARSGVPIRDEYIERARRRFGARVEVLDFASPAATETVNAWVREHTRGLIRRIVDRLDPDAILYLLNAIAFRGRWSDPFDPASTGRRPFARADGTSVEVPTMYRSASFDYRAGDGWEGLRLPYGDDRRAAMYLFLPAPESSLERFVERLEGDSWNGWIDSFTPAYKHLSLPRWELSYETELNEVLDSLGMGIAFDPNRAEFEGLLYPPPRAFLQEALHKAVVRVDEEGTVAAAVTSVSAGAVSFNPSLYFIVDRPYAFAIRDERSGALLFLGTVVDPS